MTFTDVTVMSTLIWQQENHDLLPSRCNQAKIMYITYTRKKIRCKLTLKCPPCIESNDPCHIKFRGAVDPEYNWIPSIFYKLLYCWILWFLNKACPRISMPLLFFLCLQMSFTTSSPLLHQRQTRHYSMSILLYVIYIVWIICQVLIYLYHCLGLFKSLKIIEIKHLP